MQDPQSAHLRQSTWAFAAPRLAELERDSLRWLDELSLHDLLYSAVPCFLRARAPYLASEVSEHMLIEALQSLEDHFLLVAQRTGASGLAAVRLHATRDAILEDTWPIHILQTAFGADGQSCDTLQARVILGYCYGRVQEIPRDGYSVLAGQAFWYLLSGDKDLYTDIVEPIGYRAKQHNDVFLEQKAAVVNRFTREFCEQFCDPRGAIDWVKLVEFNSGNLDLDKVVGQP